MGIADLQIITDPFTVAVYLEKLLIANGIFANQESIENALKRIAADPI